MTSIAANVKEMFRLYQEGNHQQAQKILNEVLADTPSFSDAMQLGGIFYLMSGVVDQAIEYFKRAIALFPNNPNNCAYLGFAHLEMGNFEEALANYREAFRINPNAPLVKRLDKIITELNMKNLPGILLNTLQKSGSVYILSVLHQRLRLPVGEIGIGFFPGDIAIPESAKRLAQGNLIAQQHLPATNRNLITLMQSGIDRLILHVRDPRQALLSWVHFLEILKELGTFVPTEYPLCHDYFSLSYDEQFNCEKYFSLSLEDKIGWHIEHYLPLIIDWIKGWIRTSENSGWGFRILFTRFQDLKLDHDNFFDTILRFYDLDPSQFDKPLLQPQKGQMNFRKGMIDEWREVFTDEQIEKASYMIPMDLAERFGWTL